MTTDQALTDIVLDALRTKFEAPPQITAETTYAEMALDSLVLIELAVHLTNVFGTEISGEEISANASAADTARMLAAKGVRAG